jgi:hypothetical protein
MWLSLSSNLLLRSSRANEWHAFTPSICALLHLDPHASLQLSDMAKRVCEDMVSIVPDMEMFASNMRISILVASHTNYQIKGPVTTTQHQAPRIVGLRSLPGFRHPGNTIWVPKYTCPDSCCARPPGPNFPQMYPRFRKSAIPGLTYAHQIWGYPYDQLFG